MTTHSQYVANSAARLTALKNILIIFSFLITPCSTYAERTSTASTTPESVAVPADIRRFQTQGDFSDVKEFLLQAIAGRGIKTSSNSYISKMLQRTREDIGGGNDIFKNAEAIGFCSATLSRQMMERDPHHIVLCPYTIVIYELAQQPGIIYLSYRRPFYNKSGNHDNTLVAIDNLMAGIIAEVVE